MKNRPSNKLIVVQLFKEFSVFHGVFTSTCYWTLSRDRWIQLAPSYPAFKICFIIILPPTVSFLKWSLSEAIVGMLCHLCTCMCICVYLYVYMNVYITSKTNKQISVKCWKEKTATIIWIKLKISFFLKWTSVQKIRENVRTLISIRSANIASTVFSTVQI